ncbi:ribonuclease E/G [Rhodobacterales bacterium 52_120_T64]|nr:ribonuclease E/G [Rhodobacterales bacterium 52_120_T64]
MSKKMLIDATHAEETRVVVVEGNKVDEFDFESLNKRQLAGNIYLAKITRVEPSLQAAFVDYGGNRHGFLAFSEVHPDYYQIPAADRQAILDEEAENVARQRDDEEKAEQVKSRSRRRRRKPTEAASDGAPSAEDAVISEEVPGEGDQPDIVEVPEAPSETSTETIAEEPTPEEVGAEETETEAVAAVETSETAADEANEEPAVETPAEEVKPEATDEQPEIDASSEDVVTEKVKETPAPRRQHARRYKIQEVIKVRQILLVQVVKEERGNKGAALTTYLSLAGRYCVLMPNTARGGGISRKITNVSDRKKLKDIANGINVPQGAGLIIRTAGAKRSKTDITRDYEYLLRQWEQIRDTTLKSMAPEHIYEEGSLIKRSIRDLYNSEIDEIIIDGERGYNEAKEYMGMLMPSHAENVKLYKDVLPLFSRFQVETYLSGMFNPTVQLKSGGYIVIGITEALVAIDVNSGRATKENSIEETARKTNLEAAEEVARQLRLRDLAGLIVIDFIDMEDRRNNIAVEKRIKDKLKTDRARIQIGRISSFGLMEMSRQRLRPGMLEASTQPCPHCHGTGITRSDDSMSLAILRELEEEGVRRRCKEVLVSVPINVANYMLNQKREHVAMIEGRFGLSVRIEADPHLISPEYRVERLKVATRIIPEPEILETATIEYAPDVTEDVTEAEVVEPETDDEAAPKKRRRRRRRGGKGRNGDQQNDENTSEENAETETPKSEEVGEEKPVVEEKPKRSRTRRRRKPEAVTDEKAEEQTGATEAESPAIVEVPEGKAEVAEKPKRKRAPRKRKVVEEVVEAPTEEATSEPAQVSEPTPTPEPAPVPVAEPTPTPEPEPTPDPVVEQKPEEPAKPKRRGWWSLK